MSKAIRYTNIRNFLVALALVTLSYAIFVPALPAYASPVITLVPSSGAVGTAVTIEGTVFDSYKGDTLHIFFDTREIDNSPITVRQDGTFNITFNVTADITGGQHVIKVSSETTSTSFIAKSDFMVDATVLTLDAAEGPIGTTVNINGSGFFINSSVTLYYYNPDAQKIGTVATSSTGKLVRSYVIPAGPAGQHKIAASNDQGNSAEIQFRVQPQIKLSLDSAGPGDSLNVRGGGFAALSVVNVFFGTLSVASGSTDNVGNFEIEFNVPDVKPLTYNVKSQDDKGNSSTASFTVTAGAKLSENSGPVGSDLTVQGGGFKAVDAITIYYDDQSIATTNADNNGDFTVTITVPPSDGGKHIITISDGATKRELSYSVETQPPPVPTLRLPVDNSLTRAEAHFEWLAVTDASVPVTYDLEIASDRNFASVVFHKTGLIDSQYTLTANETLAADFKNAPYFWRVRAIDGAGNVSEWSASWALYISVPPVPALQLPATDSQVVELPLRFSWQAVASLSLPVTYNLQIAKDLDFTSPLLNKTGLGNSELLVSKGDNLKLKKGTTYYWRVQAVDAAHNASGWSTAGSFRFVPKSAFPGWATYTLISLGAVIAILLAFRLGRKTAYH